MVPSDLIKFFLGKASESFGLNGKPPSPVTTSSSTVEYLVPPESRCSGGKEGSVGLVCRPH